MSTKSRFKDNQGKIITKTSIKKQQQKNKKQKKKQTNKHCEWETLELWLAC